MKRIFTLISLLAVGTISYSQRLLTEDFNYAVGYLTDANLGGAGAINVAAGNWTTNTGTGNYLQVIAGTLSYSNYFTGPTGTSNKLSLVNFPTSSEDAFRSFTPVTAASLSTVYASVLINVRDLTGLDAATTGAGDYFFSLLPSTSTSAYSSRLYIRKGVAANTFALGISAGSPSTSPVSSLVVYGTGEYAANTTHLVTIAYQFVAGAANDVAKLFVDAPYSATEPAVPNAISTILANAENIDIGRLAVRQGALNNPNVDLDAMKVSTSYADATLPLSLTSFNATFNGKASQLTWSSLNELNVSGFSVEKSLNAKDFSAIGFVSAKNNALQNIYSFDDANVKSGANYYRLKMMDKDGSAKYSQVLVVNNKATVNAEVYPNPAFGNLTISHPKAANAATISFFNAEGRLVKKAAVQAGSIQTGLSITELTKGNYVLVFESEGAKSVTKFVKQ